jgi:AhpD family alkylhydroperoxidase
MSQRLNFAKEAPDAYKAMVELGRLPHTNGGLDSKLLELVKIRASQINGCAFCLHLHIEEGRKLGETDERMYLLDAWREAPLYTPRERAALAYTEEMTRLIEGHMPDAVFDEARKHFDEKELSYLSVAITVINSWNRLMVSFRVPPRVQPTA